MFSVCAFCRSSLTFFERWKTLGVIVLRAILTLCESEKMVCLLLSPASLRILFTASTVAYSLQGRWKSQARDYQQ